MEKNQFDQLKIAADRILKSTTVVTKRKTKSETDKRRELFVQTMSAIEEAIVRSNLAYSELGIDYNSYDEKFFTAIDNLFLIHYGPQCFELISWYLYERDNPDGTKNYLVDEQSNEIHIENLNQLYDLLLKVNPKI